MFGTASTEGAWFVEVENGTPPHSVGPFQDVASFDKLCILLLFSLDSLLFSPVLECKPSRAEMFQRLSLLLDECLVYSGCLVVNCEWLR